MTGDERTELGAFRLGWRFTQARNSFLEADALARLRPLPRDAACTIADEAERRRTSDGTSAVTFRSDELPGAVLDRLRGLPVPGETRVIVSWDRETALATDWESFVSHWGDFCYPASDDVTVWSPEGDWTLCYRRYEVFQFHSRQHPGEPAPPIAATDRRS